MRELICVFGLMTVCTADLSNAVGKCKQVTTINSADVVEKFIAVEGGNWQYKMLPESDETKAISWMSMTVTKGESKGSYSMKTTYQIKGYKDRGHCDDNVKTDNNGELVSCNSDNKATMFKVMSYEPNKYAYCYRCTEGEGDGNHDQRFVLTHGALDDATIKRITGLDKKNKFEGSLMYVV